MHRRTATALVSAFALIVSLVGPEAAGSTHSRGAALQDEDDCYPEEWIPDELLDQLEFANEDLADLIEFYGADFIDDEQMLDGLDEVSEHLILAILFAPPVYGVPFAPLVTNLFDLNQELAKVEKLAKKKGDSEDSEKVSKDILEALRKALKARAAIQDSIIQSGCIATARQPSEEGICQPTETLASPLSKLARMRRVLSETREDYEDGEIDDVDLAQTARKMADLKADAMEIFPEAMGLPFIDIYTSLSFLSSYSEQIRRNLNRTGESSDDGELRSTILDLLEDMKFSKEVLEDDLFDSECYDAPFALAISNYYMGNFNVCTVLDTEPAKPNASYDIAVTNGNHTETATGALNTSGHVAVELPITGGGQHTATATVRSPRRIVIRVNPFFVNPNNFNQVCE